MSVSKSYASALYSAGQAVGASGADLDKLGADLSSFAAQVDAHPQLRSALCGPAISVQEKVAVIERLGEKAGWHPVLVRFLGLVSRKGRMDVLSDIAAGFARVRVEAAGGVLGVLESSDPLSDEDLQQLAAAFSQKLGKKVTFEKKTNPELLAGVKVTVGGTTYDGTLKAQLNRLREAFFGNSSSTH